MHGSHQEQIEIAQDGMNLPILRISWTDIEVQVIEIGQVVRSTIAQTMLQRRQLFLGKVFVNEEGRFLRVKISSWEGTCDIRKNSSSDRHQAYHQSFE